VGVLKPVGKPLMRAARSNSEIISKWILALTLGTISLAIKSPPFQNCVAFQFLKITGGVVFGVAKKLPFDSLGDPAWESH
jgi:hypothetical protein